jgi:hypothetical protein
VLRSAWAAVEPADTGDKSRMDRGSTVLQ